MESFSANREFFINGNADRECCQQTLKESGKSGEGVKRLGVVEYSAYGSSRLDGEGVLYGC